MNKNKTTKNLRAQTEKTKREIIISICFKIRSKKLEYRFNWFRFTQLILQSNKTKQLKMQLKDLIIETLETAHKVKKQ